MASDVRVPEAQETAANVGKHRAADGQTFQIRPCASVTELDRCVQLQQQAWGYPDAEVVPRNMYVLAQALGGHVFAAWSESGALAGFAMAIAAHQPAAGASESWMQPVGVQSELPPVALQAAAPPLPYLHSHMLAVAEPYRNSGLGFALKQAQRADALARGIGCMRWTFDPRVAKNAFFNLHRLGAVATRCIPNFYGLLGSALQGGLPTDRLLAEWRLDSERVRDAAALKPRTPAYAAESIVLEKKLADWRGPEGPEQAEQLQSELRGRLEDAFRRGLVITDFTPARDGGGTYRLSPGSGN